MGYLKLELIYEYFIIIITIYIFDITTYIFNITIYILNHFFLNFIVFVFYNYLFAHSYLVSMYGIYEGAHGVMAFVVGNEHGNSSSNPGLGCLHLLIPLGKVWI